MTTTVLTYRPQAPDRAQTGRYALLALLCAAAAIAYVQRNAIAVPQGLMEADLRLDKVRFGAVMSMWMLGYAAGQIPCGWLGDRWGERNTLTLYALLWSVATGLVAVTRGYGSLLAVWSFMGIAQAGLFPCAARAIKRTFAEAQRASATGLLATSMGVGGAIAPIVTGILLTVINWRWVFVLLAIPGIAWAAVFFYWLKPKRGQKARSEEESVRRPGRLASSPAIGRERPTRTSALQDAEVLPLKNAAEITSAMPRLVSRDAQRSAWPHSGIRARQGQNAPLRVAANREVISAAFPNTENSGDVNFAKSRTPALRVEPSAILTVFGSQSMWLLCAQQFLRAAAMIFFGTWFPTFLRESRHVTIMQSGLLTALAGVGAVFGCLLGGFVSDAILAVTSNKRLSRQGIAVVGMTLCAGLIVCAYFIRNTTLAVSVIGAGAFCGTFGGVSGYTVAMDFGGKRVATVFGVMNMCGNIGAAMFPLVIGWLVKRSGNWNMVLFIFAGIFAVDAILWAMLNPKRPLFEEE